jgi:hypothetical protein
MKRVLLNTVHIPVPCGNSITLIIILIIQDEMGRACSTNGGEEECI